MPPARRPRSIIVTLTTALTLVLASATAASGAVLDTAGSDPSIAVDASGTGHVAWYTRTGSAFPYQHFVRYCRLAPGQTACSKTTDLPTPDNLDTFDRTQVLVDGSRVFLLASLAGATQGGTFVWQSPNGGESFDPPVRLLKEGGLKQAFLGPGPFAITTIGEIPTRYGTGSIDGSTKNVSSISLGSGVGTDVLGAYAYSAGGLLNAATPWITVADGGDLFFRKFDASKTDFNDPANWLPAQQIGSAEWQQNATSGPSGSFLSSEPKTGNPLGSGLLIRRIADDGTVGPPQNVAKSTAIGTLSAVESAITQDASGRVHVAYLDNAHDNKLMYQWSRRGETWGVPTVIAEGGNGFAVNTQIGAGPDGGGWIVQDRVPGAVGEVRIHAFAAKGDADPPLDPGAVPSTTPPPPPAATCPAKIAVSAAADAMVRTGPCFSDLGKGRYRTTGTVRLAGIDFVPSGGGALTVDTKAHTVETSGGQHEIRAGSVVLSRTKVAWDLDGPITITSLEKFGVALLGFKLAGKADLTFAGKEAKIHLWLQLPDPLSGVRGETDLRLTMADGLRLDGVRLRATGIPIGPLFINDLDLAFTGGTSRFEGSASITLPPAPPGKEASIKAAFGMDAGAFKHLDLDVGPGVPPLPLPLFPTPPIFLNRVGLHVSNDEKGFRLAGGVSLALGPAIAGTSAISIDAMPGAGGTRGAYLFVPKAGKHAEIGAAGSLRFVDFPMAYGSVKVRTDGPVTFQGGTAINLGLATLDFSGGGGLDLGNGDWYAQLSGKLGAGSSTDDPDSFIGASASADAIISSLGIAACGTLTGTLFGASVTYGIGADRPWGGSFDIGSCAVDAYKPASLKGNGARARRLQAGGPQALTLGGGKLRGVRVKGAGGTPGFTFAGPGGRTVTVPPNATQGAFGKGLAAVPTGTGAVEIQVQDPAGSWTLTPMPEGPAVTDVLTAAERSHPKAKGAMKKGAGARRELTVNASDLGGQRLIVRELLPGGGAQELGTIRKAGRSTLRFTPAPGPGGRRKLEAVVVNGTRQVDTVALGSYTAPSPAKLVAPRSVTLKRTTSAVTARWAKVPGAAGYRVRVKGDDGRLQLLSLPGRTTRAVIPGVTADDRLDVAVVAVSVLGREGRSRSATSKGKPLAKAKPKTPKKTRKATSKKTRKATSKR